MGKENKAHKSIENASYSRLLFHYIHFVSKFTISCQNIPAPMFTFAPSAHFSGSLNVFQQPSITT